MNPIRSLKRRLYPLASRYVIWSMLMEGSLSKTGQRLRCLFIGNSLYTRYLIRTVFAEPKHIVETWRMWLPALRKNIRSLPDSLDMCIAVLPKEYDQMLQGLCTFTTREYIGQAIDISGTWEEIRSRFHKKKRQISNNLTPKYGLSYRISTDTDDFDHFYYQMHLPHTRRQFGEFSLIASYEDMKKSFKEGFLLIVMSGGCSVAALLCTVKGRVLVAYKLGMIAGDEQYIKNGALMSLYYFQILYAKEHNFQKIDLSRIPSLIDSGIYRTKREWGATVYPDNEATSRVYFFIPQLSDRVIGFFENTPMILTTDKGLKVLVGISSNSELTDTAKNKLIKRFYAPGLESLLLLSQHSPAPVEIPFKDFSTGA